MALGSRDIRRLISLAPLPPVLILALLAAGGWLALWPALIAAAAVLVGLGLILALWARGLPAKPESEPSPATVSMVSLTAAITPVLSHDASNTLHNPLTR